jgi:import inner membrane translocase subunit TIM21
MHTAENSEMIEAPLTVGEKISSGFWLGALALGGVCFIFTLRELWPSSTSPNAVFDEAFNQIRKNDEVVAALGEPLKAYGIDHGGNREGRRNFIMSREVEGEDGSKRLKIRFNLEGKFAGGVAFAEVSNDLNMGNGEWVYLIVQVFLGGEVMKTECNLTPKCSCAEQKNGSYVHNLRQSRCNYSTGFGQV